MFAVTFALCASFMWMLGLGVYMALVMSTTSVGVVFPILREMNITKTHIGQDIILGAIIADFGTMMLIPMARLVEVDPGASLMTYFGLAALIMLVFGFFFLFFVLGGLAMWKWPHDMAKFFKADDPSEMGVRASFLILMTFVAVALTLMREEGMILGAFLAGVAINFVFREGALLERKLFGFGYGFLIPLFFIKVGVDFTESVRLEGLYILPALIGIGFAVKIVPSLQWIRALGVRNTMASGILLSARLSLLIAAVRVGVDNGIQDVIDNEASLIILALVMCVAAPIVFRYLYVPPKGEEEAEEVEPMYNLINPGDE
jgi:Kef-type K+ transport system membrane component KefB